ncbi:MAG TPA: DoxX family protein [Gemmataceae bacterium]|nr:DoxX family protein [Gemmataceae bacterium]
MKKIPWVDIALWIPTLFLAWVFGNQGWSKFSDTSGWSQAFAAWHFPVWFRLLIGVCEVSAAALLLTRRTAPIGAALIAIVMSGGMGTHVYWGHPSQVTSEVVPLALSLIVLVGRRRHLTAWIARWRLSAE